MNMVINSMLTAAIYEAIYLAMYMCFMNCINSISRKSHMEMVNQIEMANMEDRQEV